MVNGNIVLKNIVLNKQINDETECDDCTSEGSLVAMNCFAWINIINL